MTWIIISIVVVLTIVVFLTIPVFAGAIFRIFLKTPRPSLLAILVGTVLFFFNNMLMERRDLGLLEDMTKEIMMMQQEGMPMPILVPAMLAALVIIPSVLFPAYLAQFGISLVDKKRNKNPNQLTLSITGSAGSE